MRSSLVMTFKWLLIQFIHSHTTTQTFWWNCDGYLVLDSKLTNIISLRWLCWNIQMSLIYFCSLYFHISLCFFDNWLFDIFYPINIIVGLEIYLVNILIFNFTVICFHTCIDLSYVSWHMTVFNDNISDGDFQ